VIDCILEFGKEKRVYKEDKKRLITLIIGIIMTIIGASMLYSLIGKPYHGTEITATISILISFFGVIITAKAIAEYLTD
jgi:divalent metal cation (Fe/Co/Zn/Cd) transporter